ncbi:MAG: hypothetical protein PHG97_02505 [Candidatus Margulisbacteria bacterium]|nr:hypothetical protein [Candidatus Margulisiibacteriota bacterium]
MSNSIGNLTLNSQANSGQITDLLSDLKGLVKARFEESGLDLKIADVADESSGSKAEIQPAGSGSSINQLV